MAKVSKSGTRETVELESTNGVFVRGPKTWELYKVTREGEHAGLEEFCRYASPLEVELLQALVSGRVAA